MLPWCTFVPFVFEEVQMLEPQRTRRYTKDATTLDASVYVGNEIKGPVGAGNPGFV